MVIDANHPAAGGDPGMTCAGAAAGDGASERKLQKLLGRPPLPDRPGRPKKARQWYRLPRFSTPARQPTREDEKKVQASGLRVHKLGDCPRFPQAPSRMDMTAAGKTTMSTRLVDPPIKPCADATPPPRRRSPGRVHQASRKSIWCPQITNMTGIELADGTVIRPGRRAEVNKGTAMTLKEKGGNSATWGN